MMTPEQMQNRKPAEKEEKAAKPDYALQSGKTELAPKVEKAQKAVPPKQAEKAALTERAKRSAPAEKAASSTKKGKMYEEQVAAYIKALGYQIREQNFRCFYGEIDLIAQKGKDLFLIEVKGQRQDYQAELKVNYAKRQRILNASAEYLRCCNLWQDYAVHYDVAVVTGNQVHYYADAFEW